MRKLKLEKITIPSNIEIYVLIFLTSLGLQQHPGDGESREGTYLGASGTLIFGDSRWTMTMRAGGASFNGLGIVTIRVACRPEIRSRSWAPICRSPPFFVVSREAVDGLFRGIYAFCGFESKISSGFGEFSLVVS